MTAEIGLFFLILALCTALLQATFLIPSQTLKSALSPCLAPAAWLQALCISLALATLITLRLESDFSVANVVSHSNLTLPTLYKIAGTWGNHEGSMLLWVWVLAAFGATLAMRDAQETKALSQLATSVQAAISIGALVFILLTSNPFMRVFPPPADGEALNPLLQDIALSIHPPLLYLGYVGFSIVFSLAAAAMLQGRMGRGWAQAAHPWILASWSCLTLGIGLGSWWAYRVLGWGGFWFWDPVENASLLPWLSGTALLHANAVLKKRGMLTQWVLLLSIITFGMSLLGTFLVRSGVLISVHSFASDPDRGLFILIYIMLLLGGALLLFALRGGKLASEKLASGRIMRPASREGMIVINNLFLLTACATILLGTLYPLFSEWIGGEKITVGYPYFNATALPLLAVALLFAGLVPFMPWKKARLRAAFTHSLPALWAAIAAAVLVLAFMKQHLAIGAVGLGLAAWLAAASFSSLRRSHYRRRHLAFFLAHSGAALLVAGITCASLWKEEHEAWMGLGSKVDIAGYEVMLTNVTPYATPDYQAIVAELRLGRDQASPPLALLKPEYRIYHIRNNGNAIVSTYSTYYGDFYSVIGKPSAESGKIPVRLYYNPMIGLLWAGFMLMALGGGIGIIQAKNGANKNKG